MIATGYIQVSPTPIIPFWSIAEPMRFFPSKVLRSITGMLAACLLIASSVMGPAFPSSETTVIDRMEATVGDRLVTLWDVSVQAAMAEHDRGLLAELQRDLEPLDAMIDHMVIRGLAGEVSIYQPTSTQIRERAHRVKESWADPADFQSFLKRHGLNENTLSGLVFSRLVVEKVIVRNLGLPPDGLGITAQQRETYENWISAARNEVNVRRTQVDNGLSE